MKKIFLIFLLLFVLTTSFTKIIAKVSPDLPSPNLVSQKLLDKRLEKHILFDSIGSNNIGSNNIGSNNVGSNNVGLIRIDKDKPINQSTYVYIKFSIDHFIEKKLTYSNV
jgi:hypothetical protein